MCGTNIAKPGISSQHGKTGTSVMKNLLKALVAVCAMSVWSGVNGAGVVTESQTFDSSASAVVGARGIVSSIATH